MMLEQLRNSLRALEKPAALDGEPGCLPLSMRRHRRRSIGGGLARGALHEIAAVSEAHLAAATGFALGLTARKRARLCWIAEDMALAESGTLYGGGLDAFALSPSGCSRSRPLGRAISCGRWRKTRRARAMGAVIGEWRHGAIDACGGAAAVARRGGKRRVSFCAPRRATDDASTAATRWIVGGAPSAATAHGLGPPRFAAHIIRNRRGPLGASILEWSDSDDRFLLAPAQPVALPAIDRPHRQGARQVA